MGRIEKSIEIKAPPEKVWEMLALDRFPEWMEGYKSVEYTSEVHTSEDKYRVGASAHIIWDVFWMDFVITENLENEKISGRSTSGNMTLIMTYTLKPTESGTEMTYVIDYELHSILMKIIDKLTFHWSKKTAERSFKKLKSILER